ncbi:hypothetical protein J7L60_07015 [Candidatus Bathyarchaeota archaeon]|nr:hypothetical protein [Candidatus Bathyarchaeota archaeon]
MTNFIFMLTHNDVTVPNAIEVFKEIKDTEVKYVGFKDVGLPLEKMRTLVDLMRREGKTIFLEVVSESKEEEVQSAKNAIALNVDYLIGGTHVEQTLQLLKGKIKYMPYIGNVVGHPCMLRGELDEIVADAERVEGLGVSGINLLAYRYDGNVDQLIESVKNAVHIPIIVAGSINSFERIRKVIEAGVWGFTIGTAIFEKKFALGRGIRDQITEVIREVKRFKRI